MAACCKRPGIVSREITRPNDTRKFQPPIASPPVPNARTREERWTNSAPAHLSASSELPEWMVRRYETDWNNRMNDRE